MHRELSDKKDGMKRSDRTRSRVTEMNIRSDALAAIVRYAPIETGFGDGIYCSSIR